MALERFKSQEHVFSQTYIFCVRWENGENKLILPKKSGLKFVQYFSKME